MAFKWRYEANGGLFCAYIVERKIYQIISNPNSNIVRFIEEIEDGYDILLQKTWGI